MKSMRAWTCRTSMHLYRESLSTAVYQKDLSVGLRDSVQQKQSGPEMAGEHAESKASLVDLSLTREWKKSRHQYA